MDEKRHFPSISVVIPVFNLEAHLAEAVESVRWQTFQNFELILVDDGSTDRSREIIARCQRQDPGRVRTLFREHAGAAAARNAGIDAAVGEWIAFLDGDDVWRANKLEAQLEVIRREPQTNLVSTAAEVIGQGRPLLQAVPESQDIKRELLRKGCFIILSSVLVRKELLRNVRFDESLQGAQDLDLYMRLPDPVRFRFLPEPLILYRVRPGSISDPLTMRYAQLGHHYRIVRREAEKMKSTDPGSYWRLAEEHRAQMARLAHEAAYFSLTSRTSSLLERLILSCSAIREQPCRLKNYRFLLQSLLPRPWRGRSKAP
jgi:glycosyltransferase involved in cell wall biosynthesis